MVSKLTRLSGWMAEITVLAVIGITAHGTMNVIGISLIVGVAFKTAEIFPVVRINMAGIAIIPFVIVHSREDGEKLGVMISEIFSFAGRMAKITIGRIIGIPGNTTMIIVRLRLIMFMAGQTAEILI